jgi:hypothetical protein
MSSKMDVVTILRELEQAWEAGSLPGRSTTLRCASFTAYWIASGRGSGSRCGW